MDRKVGDDRRSRRKQQQKEVATARPAAGKKISVDAADVAVLSELDDIFHIKKKEKSELVLARALLNTVVHYGHYGSPLVSDVHQEGSLRMFLCGSISSKKNLIGRF